MGFLKKVLTGFVGKPPRVDASSTVDEAPPNVEVSEEPDAPVGFGYKMLWFAVRTESPEDVASVLKLVSPRRANWRTGVAAAYAYRGANVFVTPAVDGWVMALGGGIPDPSDASQLAAWRTRMQALSSRFREAQFFGSHRVSSYSAWGRYRDGVEVRLFAWADDTIHDQGEPTPDEIPILRHVPDRPGAGDEVDMLGEEHVMALARAWSIDPTSLDASGRPSGVGFLGVLRALA